MIDGLMYGSACGFMLIIAVVIGMALNRIFGPGHPSISGGPVIGERLSERSATALHYSQYLGRMDAARANEVRSIAPRNAEMSSPYPPKGSQDAPNS